MNSPDKIEVMPHQVYIPTSKPIDNTPKALFTYCVEKAIDKKLLSSSYTHSQWANLLFAYEKRSSDRISNMSIVKREFGTYFTHATKYALEVDKIKRDFPNLFGIKEKDALSGEATCEDVVHETIKVLNKEIVEQKNPENIETFKGKDLSLLRKRGNTNIYKVELELGDGQEPHFHDGIPFTLKVYGKKYICEAIDFDYESGQLFFTSTRFVPSASFCSIMLDSTFILEGLRQRLSDIEKGGVDGELPFTKFFFGETSELKDIPHEDVPIEYKEKLDDSQQEAFDAALDKDITFIWGPPGTGKSFTLASIIYALYKLGEDRTAVCCLSNVAVDQLLGKVLDIIEQKKDVVKPGNIYRAGRTIDNRIIDTHYLFPNDEYTEQLRSKIKSNNEKLRMLKNRKRDMSEEAIGLKAENKELRENLKNRTDYLVKSSRVVFSTISNFVLSNNLSTSSFDNLIIDEASMLAMPSLIALGSKISKRLIMVGDFQQLSPIAMVKDDYLTDSVFEMTGININDTSHPGLHQLLHQRRSNEKIVSLINNTFYKGKLIPTISGTNEIINSEPFKGQIVSLKSVVDGAVRFTKGGTRQNKASAEAVMDILDEFYEDDEAEFSIGVITPYKGQVSLLRALRFERRYSEQFNDRVKIGTIHTFQGSECDVIIFDIVDCEKQENGRMSRIGRLYAGEAGERLINVAVSRARHKLIVVCDPSYIRMFQGNTITVKTYKVFESLSRYK